MKITTDDGTMTFIGLLCGEPVYRGDMIDAEKNGMTYIGSISEKSYWEPIITPLYTNSAKLIDTFGEEHIDITPYKKGTTEQQDAEIALELAKIIREERARR